MTEQDKQALADIDRAFDRAVEICGKDMVVRFLTGKGEGWIVENPPAQPVQAGAEPVATWTNKYGMREWEVHALRAGWAPSHNTTPARVPLTDEEIAVIASTPCAVVGSYVHTFARAIERAHGIGGGK